MRTALLLAAVALAGCQTPQQLQATVGNASNFQLCRAIMMAPADVASIASGEAARRSLDCRPYTGAVVQGEQSNDAATSALSRQILAPPAVVPPAPPFQATTCRSYWLGNVLQTTCN